MCREQSKSRGTFCADETFFATMRSVPREREGTRAFYNSVTRNGMRTVLLSVLCFQDGDCNERAEPCTTTARKQRDSVQCSIEFAHEFIPLSLFSHPFLFLFVSFTALRRRTRVRVPRADSFMKFIEVIGLIKPRYIHVRQWSRYAACLTRECNDFCPPFSKRILRREPLFNYFFTLETSQIRILL